MVKMVSMGWNCSSSYHMRISLYVVYRAVVIDIH